MSENETRLSTAMRALRETTGPRADEDAHRVQDYVEAIEIELDRIKRDRDLR